MATTTNYGWTTPDDTALVKDGASAIRTLGSSVDTTTKALNPSTTLGDIEYRSSTANTNTRLGIGTTGQVLSVSGGVPAWATATSGGLTLIKRASFSNVANTGTTFDNVFTTSYFQYLVVLESISASTSTDDLEWQSRYGGTTLTTNYYGAGTSIGYLAAAANIQLNNANQLTLSANTGTAGGEGSSANIYVSQVGNTSQNMNLRSICFTGSIALHTVFSGAASNAQTYDGFLLKSSSSNITGTASVYGLAK